MSTASRTARLKRWYVETAIHSFNILLTFTALNVALAAWFALRSTRPERYNPASFPRDQLAAAYGDLPMDVVMGTLDETWNVMKLEAKPWVHYGEAEISGKYVNVSREGVRSNGRREARPASGGRPFHVFAFGGSTMWGYGVPDWETIPAHLERALQERHPDRAVEVRNYGRGYYASSQELALFLSLLRSGEAPDAVVFLDGLNEVTSAFSESDSPSFNEPAQMRELEAMWTQGQAPDRRILPAWLPLTQAIDRIKSRARARTAKRAPAPAATDTEILVRAREDAGVLLRIYEQNRRVIEHVAADAAITPYFFWQPVPLHAYDLKKHLFPMLYTPREAAAMRALYELMPGQDPAVVSLSEVLARYDKPAFVDAHHYSPAVCKLLAERIAERIVVPGSAGP